MTNLDKRQQVGVLDLEVWAKLLHEHRVQAIAGAFSRSANLIDLKPL
jgi:hypothetical protein